MPRRLGGEQEFLLPVVQHLLQQAVRAAEALVLFANRILRCKIILLFYHAILAMHTRICAVCNITSLAQVGPHEVGLYTDCVFMNEDAFRIDRIYKNCPLFPEDFLLGEMCGVKRVQLCMMSLKNYD